jgi:hypothetical protein
MVQSLAWEGDGLKPNSSKKGATAGFAGASWTLVLLLAYLLLAVVLTWPTTARLATHLPGDGGDDPAIAWNLWWVRYALLNLGEFPFLTNYMFYPIGVNLAFYTLTVLNAVTALPLTLNLGVVAANNLHLLFTLVTGGYGACLLVRSSLAESLPAAPRSASTQVIAPLIWLSAAIAGGMYAFASHNLFYVALGQFNVASSHWLPFAILFLFRSHRQPHSLKNPLMAALFFTFQAWSELTYASFLLVFTGLSWLYLMLGAAKFAFGSKARVDSSFKQQIRNASILLAGFSLGLSPILASMLPDLLTEGDFWVEGSGFAAAFSADLLGFIIPTIHHPFFENLIRQTNIGQVGSVTGFDKGQHIYLGGTLLTLLCIAVATSRQHAAVRFWLVAAAFFFLLCLGPTIVFNGQSTGITGAFVFFQELPFFRGNRYPSRYSVMLLLSLSVTAGYALVWIGLHFGALQSPRKLEGWRAGGLEDRKIEKDTLPSNPPILRRRSGQALRPSNPPTLPIFQLPPFQTSTALLLIAALFLFEHLAVPLPQSDMRLPEVYQPIIAAAGSGTVLDIPFAWRNGFRITGALTTQFMFGQFHQTAHQRPLLQGNTSRNPKLKFQYFTGAPLINSLLALETGHLLPAEQWATDQAMAAEVLRFFNIRYIVVRPYHYDRFDGTAGVPVDQEAVATYIEQVLPVEKIYDQGETRLYRVTANLTPPSELHLATTSPLAPLYFGEGWGWLSPGRPVTAQRKQVRLMLPLPGEPSLLTLRLRLPDVVAEASRQVTVSLNDWHSSAQRLDHQWRNLTFALPAEAVQPGLNNLYLNFDTLTRLPAADLTGAPLDLTAISAGEEVGGFSHLYLNGVEVSPDRRGYNLVAMQPRVGQQVAGFDTHAQPEASAALADALTRLANSSSFIALAAGDEASRLLGVEPVAKLQALGATGDLRGCFRCSHALIINFTQRPPQIIEALDPLQPVGVTTNLGLTEPSVAAMLDTIDLTPQPD